MKNKKNEEIMHKCYYGIVAVIAHSIPKKLPFFSFVWGALESSGKNKNPNPSACVFCTEEEASLSSR